MTLHCLAPGKVDITRFTCAYVIFLFKAQKTKVFIFVKKILTRQELNLQNCNKLVRNHNGSAFGIFWWIFSSEIYTIIFYNCHNFYKYYRFIPVDAWQALIFVFYHIKRLQKQNESIACIGKWIHSLVYVLCKEWYILSSLYLVSRFSLKMAKLIETEKIYKNKEDY